MTPPVSTAGAMRRRRPLRLGVAVAESVVLIALAVLGTMRMQQKLLSDKPKVVPAIAVLPFENVGSTDGKDIADVMTEDLTNRLSTLQEVKVIGRQTAKMYAAGGKTPQQIARDLGVQYIISAKVRLDKPAGGEQLVRVSPALIDGKDGSQLWSEAYQTAPSGMFDVQSKVATQITNNLNLPLLTPARDALTLEPTRDPVAYTKYMHGRELVQNNLRVAPIRDGARLLAEATAADPRFLQAWAWLSIANTQLYRYTGSRVSQSLAAAENALRKAEALDATSPDVHLARGIFLYRGRGDLPGALAELRKASASRPSDVLPVFFMGDIDRKLARWEDAIREWKRAVDLEPGVATNVLELANTFLFLHRFDSAERYVNQAMAMAPDKPDSHLMKSRIAILARGNVFEAIEHLRQARSAIGEPALRYLLQSMTWPAVEDAELRHALVAARHDANVPAGLFYLNKTELFYYTGDSARMRAYSDSAQRATRAEINISPDPARNYEQLATALAFRGRGGEAMRALAAADSITPASRDAVGGALRDNLRVRIFTLIRDDNAALDQLEKRINIPGGMSRYAIRGDPLYSRFVSNPRYRRIVGL